jgi:transcriptional regulator with XRE-family HTH domain
MMENKIDNLDFIGDMIYKHRKLKRITQKELAEKIDSTPGTISLYERSVAIPSIDMVLNIASALDVSVDEILFSDKKEKSNQIKTLERVLGGMDSEKKERLCNIVDFIEHNYKSITEEGSK